MTITSQHNAKLKEIRKLRQRRRWRDRRRASSPRARICSRRPTRPAGSRSSGIARPAAACQGWRSSPSCWPCLGPRVGHPRARGLRRAVGAGARGTAVRVPARRPRPGQRGNSPARSPGLRRLLGRARPRHRGPVRPQGGARQHGRRVRRPARARRQRRRAPRHHGRARGRSRRPADGTVAFWGHPSAPERDAPDRLPSARACPRWRSPPPTTSPTSRSRPNR